MTLEPRIQSTPPPPPDLDHGHLHIFPAHRDLAHAHWPSTRTHAHALTIYDLDREVRSQI